MLVQLNNIPYQVSLLSRSGWLQQAKELADIAQSRNAIDAAMHSSLMEMISKSKPLDVSKGYEIYGIAYNSIISSLQLTKVEDYRDMKAAFQQGVKWIEIETSSQCNRQCSYCPNSKFDRRSGNKFFDVERYRKMIRELTEIDYEGDIIFVGNNEFFMHKENFSYLEETRSKLPNAKLKLISNGDYINRALLDRSADLGVSEIIITFHSAPNAPYSEAEVLDRAFKFQKQNGISFQLAEFKKNRVLRFITKHRNMIVWGGLFDYANVGHNWATQMGEGPDNFVRITPCTYPIRQFILNYEGDIFMCCVSYKQKTEETVSTGSFVGNIVDYPTIFHAYAGDALLNWRRGVFHTAAKTGPCERCIGHDGNIEEWFRSLAEYADKRLNLSPK
ncbi:putative Radical SAM protein [Azospirillaceae bacterium]